MTRWWIKSQGELLRTPPSHSNQADSDSHFDDKRQTPNKQRYKDFNEEDKKKGSVQTITFGLTHYYSFYVNKNNYNQTKLFNFLVHFVKFQTNGLQYQKDYIGIGLNKNWQAKKHGLGDYTGGRLRLWDTEDVDEAKRWDKEKIENYTDIDVHNKFVQFNSNQVHEVLDFEGTRITVTVFLHRNWKSINHSFKIPKGFLYH